MPWVVLWAMSVMSSPIMSKPPCGSLAFRSEGLFFPVPEDEKSQGA
jgi:hypothetical protein